MQSVVRQAQSATAMSTFFSVEEIESAKCKLFDIAKEVFTAPIEGHIAEILPHTSTS